MLSSAIEAKRLGLCLFAASISALGLGAQAKSLTPEQAVAAALDGDARVEAALWDARSAGEKAREAELKKLPSLSLSASYTRLSDLTSTIAIGPVDMKLSSLDNAFSMNANMQYPIFAGFRLRESAALAALQAKGKDVSTEMVRRAVAFEARRAYWEAKRATLNTGMLEESLELATQSLEQARTQAAHGAAMKVDLLTAQMRCDQARMDLGAAVSAERRAFWNLASLVDPETDPGAVPEKRYTLEIDAAPVPDASFPSLDESELERVALAGRPETRGSALAVAAAETGRKLAEAPLYPTFTVSGSYVYADPNSRVYFQSDPWLFTGTWSLSAVISYDLGGVPANLAEREAQSDAARKSVADDRRQRETVALDVRNCLQSFLQARGDYDLVSGMIEQARENERVAEQRLAAGTASDLDLLTARMSRLRVEFSIANKLIDEQIAAADLERATALAKL
jgi:outer membrane protein